MKLIHWDSVIRCKKSEEIKKSNLYENKNKKTINDKIN